MPIAPSDHEDNRLRSTDFPMAAAARSVNFRRNDLETRSFLVVDDFGDMRSMVKNMLNSIGVRRIDLARNGEEAIRAIADPTRHYHVILCDYNLGSGKNGQQVLEEIRHRELVGVGTVFVMITAENTFEMVMGAVEYEPDSYMTKPFTKDLLRSRLEKLIVRKKDLEDVETAIARRDFEGAIALLDAKIAARPRNLSQLLKLKGELALRAADHDRAEQVYRQVLEERGLPWARLGLGKTWFAMGRYAEAAELFRQLLEENPRLTAAYDWLARIQRAQDAPREAQQTLEQAVALSPKAILRQRALGELALLNEDLEVAEKALDRAAELGRHSVYRSPATLATLAQVKAQTRGAEEGRKVLKRLQREFPDDPEARLRAAMANSAIHRQEGDEAAARASLAEATASFHAMGDAAGPELALELARTCGALGETDQAQELLRQAVTNNHADEAFLQQVSTALDDLGLDIDTGDFIAGIRREIVALNNEGVQLARAGRLDEAVGLFEEAVSRMPNNKVVNLNTARVLVMHMKRHGQDDTHLQRVRELLARVRQLDPDDQALRKVEGMLQELPEGAG